MKPVVFLGGGRITGALLAGLRGSKSRRRLVVFDRHPEKLRQLEKKYGVVTETDLRSALAHDGMVVIAVRPASVTGLLRAISNINKPLLAVSLAAGIPLSILQQNLGPPVRWARAMPSPACRNGCGLTSLTFARGFPTAGRREVTKLFAQVGTVLEIPERKFDAFTVTYSCSHGYHALATLAAAGQRLGLDRKTALTATAHALADGIANWRGEEISLQELLHEAATPGGIAAAVMKAMNRAGYAKAVQRGLSAGLARARRNAQIKRVP